MRHNRLFRFMTTDTGAIILITMLALAVRLFHLGYQSIWGDEYLTLAKYSVGNSLADLLRNIWATATHPPVYFVITHYWFKLGHSEFMMRFPSMLFGVAAVPLVYALTSRLFDRRTAALAALVAALSPIHIWYSQEARMYSLQVLLGLASTYWFVRAWQSRSSRDIALYALFTVLGMYTHTNTFYLLVAQGLFVLVSAGRDWRRMGRWVSVQAASGVLFLPWLLDALGARTQGVHIGYERGSGLIDAGYGLYTFAVGFTLGPSVAELHTISARQAIMGYLPAIVIPGLVFGALAVLGLARARRGNPWAFRFLMVNLIVPPALALAMSIYPGVPLNPRYLLIAVIPYWIAIALGIRASAGRRLLYPLPALAVLIVGVSLYDHYFATGYMKQDMRAAVSALNENAGPGDVLIVSSVELGGPLRYYLTSRDLPFYGYPPGAGLVNPADVGRDLRRLVSGRRRAWLLLGRTWSSDPHGLIRSTLDARYPARTRAEFHGVSLYCYDISGKQTLQAGRRKYTRFYQ